MKIEKIDISKKTGELRKLILENPDLPIVVLTYAEVIADDCGWWYGIDISFNITNLIEVEDCYGVTRFINDEVEFKEFISDCIVYDYEDELTDEEFDAEVDRIAKENEHLWTKCIAIYSDV